MGEKVSLDSFCEKKISILKTQYDGLIDYIDISSIDNIEKKIVNTQCLFSKEAPSRAKQLLKRGDILVSTVRPNLNAVALVDTETENLLVGSTGYCVLRCNNEVDRRFVFYFCQSPYFVDQMSSQATGASYPAVSSSIVRSVLMPLYSLEEQRRVANLFDRVTNLIFLRKQQLVKLDELVKARFVELFGDPILNPYGWAVVTVGDIVTDVRYGTSKPAVEGGKYPYLRMNNLTYDGHLDLSDMKYIDIPDNEIEKCIVRKGDVLFNRTNSIELVGKTCVFDLSDDMVIAGYIIRVRLNEKLLPIVLSSYMNLPSLKEQLRSMAKGAVNQANINAQELQSIKIYLPPIELQKQFAAFVEQTDKSKLAIQQSLDKLELLKKALMQKLFG